MDALSKLPEWIGTAALGAVIALLGYVGKGIAEWVAGVLAKRRARRARLAELLALVRAGDAAFAVQSSVRDKLKKSLVERNAIPNGQACSYDRLFARSYNSMTDDEREMFDIVRAYTIHTFKPLNDALLNWLSSDAEFRVGPPGQSPRAKLAAFLCDLEAHLLLWRAKYNSWIPEHPERALVYLADEGKHGTPFPSDGAAIVMAVLQPGVVLAPNSGLLQT